MAIYKLGKDYKIRDFHMLQDEGPGDQWTGLNLNSRYERICQKCAKNVQKGSCGLKNDIH